MRKSYGDREGRHNRGIGERLPVSHPVNCNQECPYGFDKAFCFPCYKKLLAEMRKKKREKNGI